MIKAYINIEKGHEKLISYLNAYDLDSVNLDKIASQSEVNLVCTSFSLYGKTKKNLSDLESSNKPFPTLIIVNDVDFEQTVDLIQNPQIELISINSKLEEVGARVHALVGDSDSEILEFKDLSIN